MNFKTLNFMVLALAILLCALTTSSPKSWAHDEEIPFAVAHLFFELNNTDGDLGIHALIDGEAWKNLAIEDPRGREILDVKVRGRLGHQGLTEIFFESAEPSFDELLPQEFFRRFPPGKYEIEGLTLDGRELESEVTITHVLPAPPEPFVNGLPMAQECDKEEPGYDATIVRAPVAISWNPVEHSHPDPDGGGAGVQPPVDVVIHNYEVVLEVIVDVNGEEFSSTMHAILPPGERSIMVPEEFLAQGDEFKYEVLAREESYNQTAVESCFKVE